jgi:hypothetical protein
MYMAVSHLLVYKDLQSRAPPGTILTFVLSLVFDDFTCLFNDFQNLFRQCFFFDDVTCCLKIDYHLFDDVLPLVHDCLPLV